MGGLLIILSVLVSTLLWADLKIFLFGFLLITILIFGLIGFADDYKKIKNNSSSGISSRVRIYFSNFFWFINNIFDNLI